MDLHDGDPFWPRRDGILGTHPPLQGDLEVEVAVIGGGITGALVALELNRRGHEVAVIDRRDTGGGSTSASTAMLQYEIDELLIDLTRAKGLDQAQRAYRECSRGIDLIEQVTQRLGVSCGFRRSPSVFMAIRQRDVQTLRREFDARAAAGFEVRWMEADELLERRGLVAHAAIESRQAGSVDPYALVHHALERVTERGGRVFDRTAIVDWKFGPGGVRLQTSRGGTVRAREVVVAVGYEVEALLPDLPISLHSSFALVSEPMPELDEMLPQGLLFWDHDDPYLYGRSTDDRRLLVGGRDENYRNSLRRRRALPSKTRALAAAVPKRFPRLGEIEVAFAWAGTFAETPDGLAYIGGHSRLPHAHFALGFGGNGITYSAIAAEQLADRIEGRSDPGFEALFDLERAPARPSD